MYRSCLLPPVFLFACLSLEIQHKSVNRFYRIKNFFLGNHPDIRLKPVWYAYKPQVPDSDSLACTNLGFSFRSVFFLDFFLNCNANTENNQMSTDTRRSRVSCSLLWCLYYVYHTAEWQFWPLSSQPACTTGSFTVSYIFGLKDMVTMALKARKLDLVVSKTIPSAPLLHTPRSVLISHRAILSCAFK